MKDTKRHDSSDCFFLRLQYLVFVLTITYDFRDPCEANR
jgi:hypothetical protein